jgi:hypothetical protein
MKYEKVIFLDIDGVIALDYGLSLPRSEFLFETAYPFDIECVNVLNSIIEQTDAEIVLTSQWRNEYTINELNKIFELNRIIKKPVGFTIDLGGFSRSKEIEVFLESSVIQKFVILDDMEINGFDDCFIKISPNTGLSENLLPIIISKLL